MVPTTPHIPQSRSSPAAGTQPQNPHSPDLLKDAAIAVHIHPTSMLFLQSPLDLLQRISLRQARQDARTSKGLVSKEGLVSGDGLAEIGDGVLLRLELG
jgi:hypothetical protein